MKYDPLTKEKFFSKYRTQNVVDKLVPDPFPKKAKLSISLDQQSDFYTVCYYCMFCFYYQNILQLRRWPLAFTPNKAFLENRRRIGTSFLVSFSAGFFKKNVSHIAYTSWDIGHYVYCNYLFPSLWPSKLENRVSFQVVFLHGQKVKIKTSIS